MSCQRSLDLGFLSPLIPRTACWPRSSSLLRRELFSIKCLQLGYLVVHAAHCTDAPDFHSVWTQRSYRTAVLF